MDWSEVGISIQAKESGKENNEGNEGQRRALAKEDFFARALNMISCKFAVSDFSAI